MKRREKLGVVEFDYARISENRGHDYGKGRATQKHERRAAKREKARLRRELRDW